MSDKAEPSCTVSAVIPNAVEQIDRLVDALELIVEHARLIPKRGCPPKILMQSAVGCAESALDLWRQYYPSTVVAVEAYRDEFPCD